MSNIQENSISATVSRYRPEIDGLRAFAVVAVIINHLYKSILPGGYLGVDIFFVISGYVITSSLSGRTSKDFKDFISGFYERRIKRLVPALSIFVLISSIAIILFNPLPLVQLGIGKRALFGISNITLYLRSTDYFAQSSEYNIFMHTWSLGVEEQFYILFPFLIWFSGFARQTKNGTRNLFLVVGALSTASLLCFLYLYPTNQPAAYFLMPSRFWEMAAGCLLFLGFQKRVSIEKLLEKVPPFLILALIIGVMYLPMTWAAASTIAIVCLSCLLIASLKKQTAAFKVFTNPKVVYVGLISYSLYLWHWGVLSISRWTIGIHWWSVPLQIILMLGLAVASYRWIETPLRKDVWFGKRWKTLVGGGGVLLILSAGLTLLAKFPEGALYAGDFRAAKIDDYSEYLPATNNKCGANTYSILNCSVAARRGSRQTLLLIGDSHAGHIIPLIGELYVSNNIGVNVSTSGSYPKILQSNNQGLTKKESKEQMDKSDVRFNNFTSKMISGDIVVLSSRWEHHLYDDYYNLEHKSRKRQLFSDNGIRINHAEAVKIFESKLSKIAEKLQSKGIKLIIFSPIPVFSGDENPPPAWTCMQEWFRPFINIKCASNYREERDKIDARNKFINNSLARISFNYDNVYVYNSFDILCPSAKICTTSVDGNIFFRDDDHLSREGAKYLYKDFSKFLSENHILPVE